MATPKNRRISVAAPLGEESTDFGTPIREDGTPTHGRRSLLSQLRRPSRTSLLRNIPDADDELVSPISERPPIPSALPSSGEVASTPLPILPMIVLSIVR